MDGGGSLSKGRNGWWNGQETFSLTKEEALLKAIRDRKLWRALIAYDLKGHGTSKKKVKFWQFKSNIWSSDKFACAKKDGKLSLSRILKLYLYYRLSSNVTRPLICKIVIKYQLSLYLQDCHQMSYTFLVSRSTNWVPNSICRNYRVWR